MSKYQALIDAPDSGAVLPDLDAAAKVLAARMDYPWEHMPEQGRQTMRDNAKAVIDAALPREQPVPQAMATVIKALQEDADYAWSWHCNVAMAAVDEGLGHYAANQAAARFMYLLANVDTTKHPGFPPAQQAPVDELVKALRGVIAAHEHEMGVIGEQMRDAGVTSMRLDGPTGECALQMFDAIKAARAALQSTPAPQAKGDEA